MTDRLYLEDLHVGQRFEILLDALLGDLGQFFGRPRAIERERQNRSGIGVDFLNLRGTGVAGMVA